MIGMSFASFFTLLIEGLIAAIVMHSIVRYRMLEGFDGFMAKWIAGWIGAWLGSPVLGHWWLRIQDTYLIPALVGAFIGAFSVVFLVKMFGGATLERPAAVGAVAPQILETRKAS